MQRDRIARERIHGQYIESLRRFRRERGPCIAGDHRNLRTRVADVCENVARDRLHCRIDVVELDLIAGLSIGSNRSCSKPDYADLPWSAITAKPLCELNT